MTLLSRLRVVAAGLALAALVGASPSFAQEISESHLTAAKAAVTAINATGDFDAILPTAARALKDQLTQKNPDLYDEIDKTVNEKALEMTKRYGDLQKEAATVYARVFTEAELNAIAAFYATDAGKKLLSDGPIVTRELLKAADIWQRGVARDLAVAVGEVLAKEFNANAAAGDAPVVPAAPAAPAEAPKQN